MSARALLRDLSRHGVALEVHSGELVMEGPSEVLTDAYVASLRELKAALIRALGEDSDTHWDADDLRAFFDERSSTREFGGGLPREEAEQRALSDTVEQWLALNPPDSSNPHCGCAHCGEPETPSNVLLAVLARGGHAWVHDECWAKWRASRRGEAERALRLMGIRPPPAEPD